MNSALVAMFGIIAFALAYRLYGRFITRRVLSLNQANATPSHTMRDGIDYVPTRPVILFGHHFASIAGLGPILGPAIGVMWGWVPVALWILLGTIFIGGIHDMGTLVVSIRNRGRSIGDITNDLIGPRARILFLLITFFLLSLAMGVFAELIARLFGADFYPGAVLPVFGLIFIATIIGSLVYKTHFPLSIATLIGFGLTLVFVWLGEKFPVVGISHDLWIYILLIYSFFASVLPVWLLLQPRDYVNSYLLYAGLALLYIGIAVAHPQISAPAVHSSAMKTVPMVPLLFITVACGAISGFHSLVSSGTTSKQLDRENDALPVAYGGMIAEGLLALAILIAVAAGLGTREMWLARYSSWGNIKDLSNQLSAIVDGSAGLLSSLGISRGISQVFITVVAVSFAMTTLDTGTRLLRYNISELGQSLGIPPLTNRFVASLLAVAAIGFFALIKTARLVLWQLFGSTNQLLAALGLLVVAVYLHHERKPAIYVVVPMLFMLFITIWSLLIKGKAALLQIIAGQQITSAITVLVLTILLLAIAVSLCIEALLKVRRLCQREDK